MAAHPHEALLKTTASHLSRPGHGILAADESVGTIGKRLTALALPNTPQTRRQFRQILLLAPSNHLALSGVILFHETFYQSSDTQQPFPDLLLSRNILPGVKVDTGLKPVPSSPQETYTSGLDTLPQRCAEYAKHGARFVKWRAALRIDEHNHLPTEPVIQENARTLAKYASVAQAHGLVPIVEPEILIDGPHSQEVSAAVAKRVIAACYDALRDEGVLLEGTLLKPMMIMPGVSNPSKEHCTPQQVAEVTLRVMREVVPPQVPGIMFLSGGMSEEQATRNLDALNRLAKRERVPWSLSFSFGRALQTSALHLWRGKRENVEEAMKVAAALALANGKAQRGEFEGEHPSRKGGQSLYEGFRGWRSGEDPRGV
eukprot:GFKZ01006997.1.p1 GENE.GFKZ01006997.1~~GFKZ01006997.1.p1  ORF type:complete len:372 (-),score=69.39 GFKZ01006997.1:1768-2883(-)